MKRSEINGIIAEALEFMKEHRWNLPAWAYWTPEDWKQNLGSADAVIRHQLGWDITDFGSGDFSRRGLFLFTLRNGIEGKSGPTYAEKIMIVRENQETPLHFHWHKMEDIINRGGGTLVFQIFAADDKEGLSGKDVEVFVDDVSRLIPSGGELELGPGESLRLAPYVYHRFWGKEGDGTVLVGEVSQVNDDQNDNRFYEEIGRFPEIVEDQEPIHLLVGDYAALNGTAP